ncbi:MAG: hypothetical protein GTO62_15900, partial [Planctomycetales bacterium]|nr:hypothetical protein [Planctomycetales bacterium]NIP70707.1 hypothetical protein [Planctomycetales bacterium]
DGLGPGTYFVQQMPAAGLIQPGSNTVQQVSLTAADMGGEMRTPIDTFAQPQLLEAWAPSGRVATSGSAVPDALGGERDLYLEITSAIGQIEFGVGRDRGFLHYDSSFAADGTGVLTWDGIDQG